MCEIKKYNIINISIDMFAENGIRNSSLKKIAKKAGLSRGGIYHYFRGGKKDIITSVLQIFEDAVKRSMPSTDEWSSPDADAWQILSGLFFKFEESEAIRCRKIIRIILSEMYYNSQVKEYAENYLINGRVQLLAECFNTLSANGLISHMENAERTARLLNSLVVVFAISDALSYPYTNTIDSKTYQLMCDDCSRFMTYIITGK